MSHVTTRCSSDCEVMSTACRVRVRRVSERENENQREREREREHERCSKCDRKQSPGEGSSKREARKEGEVLSDVGCRGRMLRGSRVVAQLS